MKLLKKIATMVAAPVALAGLALGVQWGSAYAGPATVTAVTHVTNAPDGGNNGTWSYDDFTRKLTVTADPSQAGVPGGETRYLAEITDTGEFNAIPGAYTPNQVVPGLKVLHAVKGAMYGTYDYRVTAPSNDPLTGTVVTSLDDHFTAATGDETSDSWPAQAFASQGSVSVSDGAWSWKYNDGCENWTDSSVNGDGNLAGDGNITGKQCVILPPPHLVPTILYDGHGTATAPTREEVTYQQKGHPGWDEFTIVGPGAINGHQGWVNGQLGTNIGYYWGLEPGHGYTSCYTPVTGQGSTTPVPGHGGCIYFIANGG